MGNVTCQNFKLSNLKDSKVESSLFRTLNSYIKSEKKDKLNNPKENKPKCIKSLSYLNRKIESNIVDLTTEFLAVFSSLDISKVNKENMYISLLMPNVFEGGVENKQNGIKESQHPNRQNYLTASAIDKLNEIFNFNNELHTNEKQNRYKMSINSMYSNTREILGLSLPLNLSRDSGHIDTEQNHNGTISKLFTRKSRLSTVHSKEFEEEVAGHNNSAKPQKNYTKSLKQLSLHTDNESRRKQSLIQIKEFEMSLNEDSHKIPLKSIAIKKRKSKFQPGQKKTKSLKLSKKTSYSIAVRKKLSEKSNGRRWPSSISPNNLLSENLIHHFKTVDFVSKKGTKLKPNVNGTTKNKNKQKFNFCINLKVIIKQSLKESLKENKKREKRFDKKDVFSDGEVNNNSTLFRDSIDRYLNLDSSCQIKNSKNKNKISSYFYKQSKMKNSIEMLSKISISNLEEKDKENSNLNLENISQDTINNNLALFKK